jgi:hypothetical protein
LTGGGNILLEEEVPGDALAAMFSLSFRGIKKKKAPMDIESVSSETIETRLEVLRTVGDVEVREVTTCSGKLNVLGGMSSPKRRKW